MSEKTCYSLAAFGPAGNAAQTTGGLQTNGVVSNEITSLGFTSEYIYFSYPIALSRRPVITQ